jgi:hypothetical protein
MTTAREAADQALGTITDEMWEKMSERWERHWALSAETLTALRDRYFLR